MKYTIEFELPDNETVLKEIKTANIQWSVWGYSGYSKVQPERKRGKWSPYLPEGLKYRCSVCGSKFDRPWNFCPACGADMREEQNEGD